MLADELTHDYLRDHMLPHGQWTPCGTIEYRRFWGELPDVLSRSLVDAGEAALTKEWPRLNATLLLDYARVGNRETYQRPHFQRRQILQDLVLAECVEDGGRFLDAVADAVWSICEESFWGWPAHLAGLPDVTDHEVDLGVGETASLISWTRYLLADRLDRISEQINARMSHETHARILTPCLEQEIGWMGFPDRTPNNWNPWICSNWLTATLVFEMNPEQRVQHVHKIARALDRFIAGYGEDGGCDEGPGYWGRAGASLIETLLRIEQAMDAPLTALKTTRIQNMARFVYRARISEDYAVNFGDASACGKPEAALVRRLAELTDDDRLRAYASTLPASATGSGRGSIARVIQGIMQTLEEPINDAPDNTSWLHRDVYLPSIEVVVARQSEGSSSGLTLAANAGHNAQSHNHNDVGSFMVFADGQPLLIDVGVETYTRKTFSADRYCIWTMQSQWHNLPMINGLGQAAGRDFAAGDVAYEAGDDRTRFAFNIARAYPAEAAVADWQRELVLDRHEHCVEVTDRYHLTRVDGPVAMHLVTPCEAAAAEPGVVRLRQVNLPSGRASASGILSYAASEDMGAVDIDVDTVEITDEKLKKEWGPVLRRIRLIWPTPASSGEITLRIAQA